MEFVRSKNGKKYWREGALLRQVSRENGKRYEHGDRRMLMVTAVEHSEMRCQNEFTMSR